MKKYLSIIAINVAVLNSAQAFTVKHHPLEISSEFRVVQANDETRVSFDGMVQRTFRKEKVSCQENTLTSYGKISGHDCNQLQNACDVFVRVANDRLVGDVYATIEVGEGKDNRKIGEIDLGSIDKNGILKFNKVLNLESFYTEVRHSWAEKLVGEQDVNSCSLVIGR